MNLEIVPFEKASRLEKNVPGMRPKNEETN